MKKYGYIFLFLFLPLIIFGNTKAIIKGQVTNPRSKKITIKTLSNYITFEPMVYELELDKDGRFEFEIEANAPKTATLHHGHNSMELFITPKEVLNVSFNGWDMLLTAEFAGIGAANNAFLNRFKQHFFYLEGDKLINRMAGQTPMPFYDFMKQGHQKKINFLNIQKKTLRLTQPFIDFMTAEIDYWRCMQLIRYRWENAFYNDIAPPLEVPMEYFDFLNEVEISNPKALSSLNYIYFLDYYLALAKEIPELAKDKNKNGEIKLGYKDRGAKIYLEGKAKYFVLATEFYIKSRSSSKPIDKKSITKFLETCSEKSYNELVNTIYKKQSNNPTDNLAPDFTLSDANDRLVSLSDFRGKVVYLNFWATWCPPCTYEILEEQETIQKADDNNIFIYVSLDTDKDNWKRFVTRQQLDGIHLFAEGLYKSEVAQSYHVRGLPTFYRINEKGELEVR